MLRYRINTLILVALTFSSASCSSSTVTIQGAGATFPAPLYQRWFLEYYLKHPDIRVNYQGIGSGAGVSQFQEGLTDFAATDEALKKERIDEVAKTISEREHRPVELIQVPLTAGAVAVCYNVPGNPNLDLPRKVYVGIALGEISFWDDPTIQKANPDVKLPHLRITFVRCGEQRDDVCVYQSLECDR